MASQQEETALSGLQADLDIARQTIQQLETENIDLQQTIDAVLVNPTYVVALAGDNLNGSFYASQETGLLILRDLPPLPETQTYQLWVIPDGREPIPSGLVNDETAGGSKPVTLWADSIPALVDAGADGTVTIAVSIEPTGGSLAPTGPVILAGSTFEG